MVYGGKLNALLKYNYKIIKKPHKKVLMTNPRMGE